MTTRPTRSRLAPLPLAPLLLPLLLLSLGQACFYDDDDDDDDDDFDVVSSGFEIEPNDESAAPHFLGVLRDGEAMIVEGHAEAGDVADPFADPFDGFAISLVEPLVIEFALFFDDDQGELDVWIYDPVIDDIALFFETDFSPETGTFFVDLPLLEFQIVVFAFAGEADYRLEVVGFELHGATHEPPANSRGSVSERPGASPFRRENLELARRRAADAYLGRRSADLGLDELPIRIGTILALDDAEPVLELPVFDGPEGAPFAVLRE